MFEYFQSKFRQFTFTNQIICINLLIILPIMIIAALFSYASIKIILHITSDSSKFILENEDRCQIANIAKYAKKIIEYKHQQVVNQLYSIQLFEQFYRSRQSQFRNRFEVSACVTPQQFKVDQRIFSIPRFCYQANGVSDSLSLPQEDKDLIFIHQFISLLDYYSLVIDNFQKGVLQIASVSKVKYFVQFPHSLRIRSYDVTQRSWYQIFNNIGLQTILQKRKKIQVQCLFTLHYQYFQADQLEIAASFSLLRNNKSLIGISKQGLLVASNLIPSIAYNILMLDLTGVVVLNQVEQAINISDPFFFYNSTVTGFNITDWTKIQNQSSQKSEKQMILFNKLFNQSVNVVVSQLTSNNFTFIIYSNITRLNDFNQILLSLLDKIYFAWITNVTFQIGFQMIAILVQSLIISIIFRPLRTLTTIVKCHAFTLGNNIISIIFQKANNVTNTDVLSQLTNIMLNLSNHFSHRQITKSTDCKEQENLPENKVENHLKTKWLRAQQIYLKNNKKINRTLLFNLLRLTNKLM